MQKKLLIIIACMIAAVVIAGIVITNQNSEKKRQIEQTLQDDSEAETVALVSLEEARKEAAAVIEAGRNGAYRNLQFDEICPLITEEDRIYQIKISVPHIPITEETLQNGLDLMQALTEEPIDENLITVVTAERISVDEMREKIREQDKEYLEDRYFLFYLNDDLDTCTQIDSNLSYLWIDRGFKGTGTSEEDRLDQFYDAGATDGSLKDVYETASSEMSVEEAIEQAGNYINHEFPIPISISKEMVYRVFRVYILKMPGGTYGFEFIMRRFCGGVPLETLPSELMVFEEGDTSDLGDGVLDAENHILYFRLLCNNEVEEIQEISEVIPLERATEYISRKVADNTVYTVNKIELSYKGKEEWTEGESYYEIWTLKWIFFTTNETNGKETRFYVDVVTGEVDIRKDTN